MCEAKENPRNSVSCHALDPEVSGYSFARFQSLLSVLYIMYRDFSCISKGIGKSMSTPSSQKSKSPYILFVLFLIISVSQNLGDLNYFFCSHS